MTGRRQRRENRTKRAQEWERRRCTYGGHRKTHRIPRAKPAGRTCGRGDSIGCSTGPFTDGDGNNRRSVTRPKCAQSFLGEGDHAR